MKLLMLSLISLFGLMGCNTIDKISDADLAANVKSIAAATSKLALTSAIEQNPTKKDVILENCVLVRKVIKDNLIPLLSDTTGDVLRGALDTAIAELSSQIAPGMLTIGNAVFQSVITLIDLPENPATRLDERTKKALIGLFEGFYDSLDDIIEANTI